MEQKKIRINDVWKYLSSNGWKIEPFTSYQGRIGLDRVSKKYGGKEMTFFIPTIETMEDYDFRMDRFMRTLSILEKKDMDDIIRDIASVHETPKRTMLGRIRDYLGRL